MNMSEVYAAIDKVVPTLQGWCSVEKARRLAEIVVEVNAKRAIELGVFGSRSLYPIALGGLVSGAQVFGIDPWTKTDSLEGTHDRKNSDWWGKLDYEQVFGWAKAAVADFDNVTLLRKRSDQVLELFLDGEIDVLHQDGNHSEESSSREVELWLSKMKPGGIWIMDDIDWKVGDKVGTAKAQGMLLQNGYVEVENFGSWAVFKDIK